MAYTPSITTAKRFVNPYTVDQPVLSSNAPFTPASISNLVTWFKGDAGLTSSSWTNYGTNATNATLNNVAVTTVNGLSACAFKSAASYGVFNMTVGSDSRSIFYVFASLSPLINGTTLQIIAQSNNGFYGGFSVNGTTTGETFMLISYGQAVEIYNTTPLNFTTTAFNTVGMSWDTSGSSSTSNYIYVNGSNLPVTWSADAGFYDYGLSVPTYMVGSSVGGTPTSSYGFTLCEMLVYGKALSRTDGSNVQSYLRSKWGTP